MPGLPELPIEVDAQTRQVVGVQDNEDRYATHRGDRRDDQRPKDPVKGWMRAAEEPGE